MLSIKSTVGSSNLPQLAINEPDFEATPESNENLPKESNTVSLPHKNGIKSNNIKLEPLFIRVSLKIN